MCPYGTHLLLDFLIPLFFFLIKFGATICINLRVGSNFIERLRSMKKSLILLVIILPTVTFSQQQIFELKNNKYYSEQNKYMKDSIWRFNQIIEYDDPGSIDEESWIRLTLEVNDTIKFMNLKRL